MKINLSGEQLYELSKHPALRVASTPFAPGKVYVGALAYSRGKVPEPLERFTGQMREVSRKCKGKKGYAFVVCLRTQAKEMGITKRK